MLSFHQPGLSQPLSRCNRHPQPNTTLCMHIKNFLHLAAAAQAAAGQAPPGCRGVRVPQRALSLSLTLVLARPLPPPPCGCSNTKQKTLLRAARQNCRCCHAVRCAGTGCLRIEPSLHASCVNTVINTRAPTNTSITRGLQTARSVAILLLLCIGKSKLHDESIL